MPYFIYRVFPFRRLEKVADAPSFGMASAQAKALRASADLPGDCIVKVIFAANENEAENLLSQAREPMPGVVGDE